YYPVNFLNDNNTRFEDEKVNLLLLSFGHDFKIYVNKSNVKQKHEAIEI
ncbi:MAG: hypothetical protein RIQ61_849, partial [Bacteroidota bacterium]